ncbi:hypothetical protein Glove_48g125 [Diversispora epigaea]|uniref:Uncharacterized protein n=1 Tax=Diversispora epigaea TaxID=1348612 RepID=A0A397JN92_9GLOM|nr:hypothetical protein Glove_48g125 [Diversispora epigaea]
MRDELIKYVESNEIEEQDIPKVFTIQGWISRYAATFKEQATEAALRTIKYYSSSEKSSDSSNNEKYYKKKKKKIKKKKERKTPSDNELEELTKRFDQLQINFAQQLGDLTKQIKRRDDRTWEKPRERFSGKPHEQNSNNNNIYRPPQMHLQYYACHFARDYLSERKQVQRPFDNRNVSYVEEFYGERPGKNQEKDSQENLTNKIIAQGPELGHFARDYLSERKQVQRPFDNRNVSYVEEFYGESDNEYEVYEAIHNKPVTRANPLRKPGRPPKTTTFSNQPKSISRPEEKNIEPEIIIDFEENPYTNQDLDTEMRDYKAKKKAKTTLTK